MLNLIEVTLCEEKNLSHDAPPQNKYESYLLPVTAIKTIRRPPYRKDGDSTFIIEIYDQYLPTGFDFRISYAEAKIDDPASVFKVLNVK